MSHNTNVEPLRASIVFLVRRLRFRSITEKGAERLAGAAHRCFTKICRPRRLESRASDGNRFPILPAFDSIRIVNMQMRSASGGFFGPGFSFRSIASRTESFVLQKGGKSLGQRVAQRIARDSLEMPFSRSTCSSSPPDLVSRGVNGRAVYRRDWGNDRFLLIAHLSR